MEAKAALPRQIFGHAVQFSANCWPNLGRAKRPPIYWRAHDLVGRGQAQSKQVLTNNKKMHSLQCFKVPPK
jgi:hypothetical protein